MYVKMVFLKLKENNIIKFQDTYVKEVIPLVTSHKGNRFTHLLLDRDNDNEAISITAWDKKKDFEAYLNSGDFKKTSDKYSSMYIEPPIEKSYEVVASSDPLIIRIF